MPRGIDPIDLSNFVSKTETWNAARVAGLRRMFYDQLDGRALLVMRANGHLTGEDSVAIEYVPYVVLRPDGSALNPRLPQ